MQGFGSVYMHSHTVDDVLDPVLEQFYSSSSTHSSSVLKVPNNGQRRQSKGKGKSHAKRVKGGKCSAEEQDVKESTDSLRSILIAEMSSLWVGFVIS